jgi:hypothetical protein
LAGEALIEKSDQRWNPDHYQQVDNEVPGREIRANFGFRARSSPSVERDEEPIFSLSIHEGSLPGKVRGEENRTAITQKITEKPTMNRIIVVPVSFLCGSCRSKGYSRLRAVEHGELQAKRSKLNLTQLSVPGGVRVDDAGSVR